MSLQLLDRTVNILRALGSGGPQGLRLVDLQRSTGLSKPTAHRLVNALVGHGLVAHDRETKRFHLGDELAVLGWSVSKHPHDLQALATQSAARVAEETGDTVFVVVRSGFDTVCIARHSGAYPVKALTVDVGTRRPLGVGAGGLAILAALTPAESDEILDAVAARLPQNTTASLAQLKGAIRDARKSGYAVSNGFVTEGVRAVSRVVRNFRSETNAAIGVAAIHARIPRSRIPELAACLDRERRRMESWLLASGRNG